MWNYEKRLQYPVNITKPNAIYHVRVRKASASRNSKIKWKKKKEDHILLRKDRIIK